MKEELNLGSAVCTALASRQHNLACCAMKLPYSRIWLLQVLRRSGTDLEKRCAKKIEPVVRRPHYLLVTLVLCNAAATEVRRRSAILLVPTEVQILALLAGAAYFPGSAGGPHYCCADQYHSRPHLWCAFIHTDAVG